MTRFEFILVLKFWTFLGGRIFASCQAPSIVNSPWPFTGQKQANVCSLGEINFDDVVFDVYSSCKSPTVVLISDDNEYVNPIWNHFTKYAIPMIQRDEGVERPQELKAWLKDVYIEHTDATFVVLLKNPARLLETVDSLSTNKTLPEISMIRHNSKWLVFSWTDEQSEGVTRQQFSSVLDNVAVVRISKEQRKGMVSTAILSVTTFMWNSKRNRLPHNVTSLEGDQKCSLFPNRKFGLNGRTLTVVTKVFFESVLRVEKIPNCNCSECKYDGPLISLLGYLSTSLNFSYVFCPAIEDPDRMSWTEYEEMLQNGTCDLGLNLWADMYATLKKHSVTYPVIFDFVTGVYRIPNNSKRSSSTRLLFPFPRIIYLFLGLCLVLTAGLYIIILLTIHATVVPDKRSHVPRCYVVVISFVDICWRLASSLFQQNYLPNPWQMSSRILIGIWSVTVVILYASHTGHVTVNLVTRPKELVTLEGLAAREDYALGTSSVSFVNDALKNSRSTILNEISSRIQVFHTNESETASAFVDNYMGANDDSLFVLFFSENFLKFWLERRAAPEQYFIMDIVLMPANGCLLLASGSELERFLSLEIIKFHEAGFLDHSQGGFKKRKNRAAKAKHHEPLDIENFFWPFVFVLYSTAGAFCVLAYEFATGRCNEWLQRNKYCRS